MTGTLPFLDEPAPHAAASSAGATTPVFVPERAPRAAGGWRLAVVGAGIAAAMLAVVGKLVVTAAPGTVPAANASALMAAAKPASLAPAPQERALYPRAKIFDRNGVLLAFSAPTHSLYAHPDDVPDPVGTAEALVRAFPDLDRDLLVRRLSSKEEFVYVARHLTPEQYFKALQLGLPGIRAKQEYRRIYPQGPLAVHVVGLTRADQTALSGIEAYYDADLAGVPDAPLSLSLDMRLQAVVREELQQRIDTYAAAAGAGVVLDTHTGEMLASVSLPDFDPNIIGKRDPKVEENRVSNGVFELGSVFKPIVAAVALDTRVAKRDTMFDATHPIYAHGYTIKDFHGRNKWLSMQDVLVHSSNIGAARMAMDVGADRLVRYFDRFGLLTVPGLEVYEVRAPQMPDKWQELNAMTAAYGYALSVSPAQFAATFAALVNGGVLHRPTYIRLNNAETAQGRRVIRPGTSATVRAMLRQVVLKGTGRNAGTHLYPVGGKTGTAMKPSKHGGYSSDKRISSFIGAFPIADPRYVVFVMVDEPKERKVTGRYATGGKVAAPAVGRIIDRIAPMLGVKPTTAEPEGDVRQAKDVRPAKTGGVITAAMQVQN